MTAPHPRLWSLGAARADVGDTVLVLAVPPALADEASIVGRTGRVVAVTDYRALGIADALDCEALFEVEVPGHEPVPLSPHEVCVVDEPRTHLDLAHPVGGMQRHRAERWRLSALSERHAARQWLLAAVSSPFGSDDVLSCTQLGRQALRQAQAYDAVADLLERVSG